MLRWVGDNIALLSGVIVPLLLGVVKPLVERETGGPELRRIRQHVQLRALLPNGSTAAAEMDRLIGLEMRVYVERASQRVGRKVDIMNLIAIAVVSLIGGGLSYGLASWAQAVSGVWAWVLWIVFLGWSIFVFLLVLVGGSAFYKKEGGRTPRPV